METSGSGDSPSVDLVIVTGQSGAGKSTTLNVLADEGYYCLDNLPTSMVLELLTTLRGPGHLRVAVGCRVWPGSPGAVPNSFRFTALLSTLLRFSMESRHTIPGSASSPRAPDARALG